ncbi:hypothetical protein BG011_001027 [Mortierella polycephala]|uniref:Uncharacterized protein n=1 Tax=Mortierella polycephala TaxID=41804 RepID=A0A9P6PHH1_9FUNG|nr:hypothetical protein BG011_001027 [Mortierella polycephala]
MCILRPFLAATRVIRNRNPDPSTDNEPTPDPQQRQPRRSLQDGKDYQRSTAVVSRKPGPTYPRQRISKYRMRELDNVSTPTVPYLALRRMASEAPDLRKSTHHSTHFWGSDKSNDSDANVDVCVPAIDGSIFSQQCADKEQGHPARQKDKDSDQGSSSDKEQGHDDNSDVDDRSQDSSNACQGGDDNGSDGNSGCEDGDDEDDSDEDDGDDIAGDKSEDNLSMAANDSNSDNDSDTLSPSKDDKGKACQATSPSHRDSVSSSGTHRSANVHAQTASVHKSQNKKSSHSGSKSGSGSESGSPTPVLQPPSHHMKIYLGGFSDGCLHGYKEAQRHAHNALMGRVAMGLDSSSDNSTARSNLTTNTQDLHLSSPSTPPTILPLHTLTAGQLQDAVERPLSENGQQRAAARLDRSQQRPPHMFGFGIIPGQGLGYGEIIAPGFVRALPGFICPYSATSQQGQNQVQGSTAPGIAHTVIPPASPASTVFVPVPSAASIAVPPLVTQVQRQAGDEEGQCTAIAKKTGLRCKRRVRANGYCHLH